MPPFRALAVPVLLALVTAARAAGPDEDDERLLQANGLRTDGPALLDFLHLRSRTDADRAHLARLVRQLGDPAAEGRAAAELVGWGPPAVVPLRQAVNDVGEPALARRARRCLQAIEGPDAHALPAAAARLLTARAPDGCADALLAYLPHADDPGVTDAVTSALADIAFAGGKPDPALLRALADPVALRRAVAAQVLCRADHPEAFPVLRKLLADPKPPVRARVALALARQGDVAAFPVLIDLLAVLPAVERRPVEEALQELAGEWAPALPGAGEDALARRIRRDVWAAWWRGTDGPDLLEEFRRRTLTPEAAARARALIAKLGDGSFPVREVAATDVAALGRVALPLLREAARDPDAEIGRQAAAIVRRFEQGPGDPLPLAAARMVALRKPAGAAEVLLAYLPVAEAEDSAAEVDTALAAVALRDGKPEPAVLKALADALPRRRAAAAEALCRSGSDEGVAAAHKLLYDADLSVRLRAATALAGAGQKDAVPVLIGLVTELPREQSWQAQEVLARLAGEGAPGAAPGDDDAGRKKAADAWAAWWKANAERADLARLAAVPGSLGYTVVVLVEDGGMGRVVELGRDGKVRWQIEGMQYPVDAWVVSGNRVLVGEYNGLKVTERDLTGRVVWEKANLGERVVNVQRLPNGHTFIATQNTIMEVDRAGKEVFSHRGFPSSLWAAYRSADGSITAFAGNRCVRLDRSGKEVKSFALPAGGNWTSGIDVTPQGRILVSNHTGNTVQEYDRDGKMVWEAQAPAITTATRAANGHTIVASYGSNRVFELDRNGKVVWEHRDALHPFRARRR